MTNRPPKFATGLLHRFLRDDLLEEVTGDLEENFYALSRRRSPTIARINYCYQVIHYLRPFAIRKKKYSPSNRYAMFQNYFKIAFRNLNKNRGYSFINIGGLAIGMAVAMLIGLWIFDEVSFDQYHTNYPELAQVFQHQTFNGYKGTQPSVPRPVEMALRTNYASDFKYMSMATWTGDYVLSAGEQRITKTGNYMQEDFPEMLSLEMISGSRKGLHDPSSILVSESTAKAIFGDKEALNQALSINNTYDVKIIGVYKDIPYSSTFRDLKFIASWELYITQAAWVKGAATEWGNNSFQLFVQVNPGADIHAISEKIKDVKLKAVDKEEAQFKPTMILIPMSNWHLRSDWDNGVNIGGRIQMVWLFGIIGGFVLLLACINFMNLSTARSEKRAKEVGIRMTIGSVRSQLINQFLSESFLVVLISFIAAFALVIISLPWFNELADKRMAIAWSHPWFWLINVSFIVFTTLLAGSYPAFYLSSFQPVKVLKGMFKAGRYSSLPRKVLVVVQFAVSVTLVIGTAIVYRQILFTKDRPAGYDRNGLVMIQMKSRDFNGKFNVLNNELKNSGAVTEFSQSSSPLTGIWSDNGGMTWKGKDPALQADFGTVWVTTDYGKTVNWVLKEGRDFSHDFVTDSLAIVMNEASVKFMNVKDPVGMEIDWNSRKYHVIGVVKDLIVQSPYSEVTQILYLNGDGQNSNWMNLRLNPVKSVNESIVTIESIFKKVIPNVPFDYKFVDEEYGRKFSDEERIGKLASVFGVLAVLISCLGLFGLASFVAEQRTKEIGIRKVLGASVSNLWQMLSKDFVLLVIIACVIAIPTAWILLDQWLHKYEYRTEISWWIFASSVVGALLITLATVSFQAIRAALMSPVNSLKTE